MSVDFFRSPHLQTSEVAPEIRNSQNYRGADEWTPERFACEQIRGLVRQVFFSSVTQPARQVVFSGVEPGTDIGQLCRRVGEALAEETKGNVAVLTRDAFMRNDLSQNENAQGASRRCAVNPTASPLREIAKRCGPNLWTLTERQILESRNQAHTTTALYSWLCELRGEFDYSIVHGPPAGQSSEAASLGQLTDGIVLVLTAHETRRAAARKIKETLEAARARILGTVLSERTFPIPTGLYRRL